MSLELLDALDHELWARLGIVDVLVAVESIHLLMSGRNQQFEYEVDTVRMTIVTEELEPDGLAVVHLLVRLGANLEPGTMIQPILAYTGD